MPRISGSATMVVRAAPELVYAILADYRDSHPRVLPRPHFGELVVERGGTGAGTLFRVEVRQGVRMKRYRMEVSEPIPGRLLVETDLDSDLVTRFAVEPQAGGRSTRVTITTGWTRGGVRGWIERLLAPLLLPPVFRAELRNVERLARERGAAPAPA